jgi:hypothetical protein
MKTSRTSSRGITIKGYIVKFDAWGLELFPENDQSIRIYRKKGKLKSYFIPITIHFPDTKQKSPQKT